MSARARAMKKAQKAASGGKIEGVKVPGASVMKEAEADNAGFKKGGMTAKGGKSKMRMDKKSRGGKYARGGSPFSAAKSGGKDAPATGDECA